MVIDRNPLLSRKTREWREARRAYLIITPFAIYIVIWNLIPLLFGLYLGLTEYSALGKPPKWVGLNNFRTFFATPDYLILLLRQILIGFLALVINTVVSFIFALLLNVKSRFKGIFRTAIYIPNIAAVTATMAVFIALLNPLPDHGLNHFLVSIGFKPVTWNYSIFWMYFWIIAYFVWQRVGPAVIIWLGGLQGIDPSLYEAAKVDGASFIQRIWYITLPGLRFISLYILLTGIIGAMQMFEAMMFISRGNPYGKTDVLMYRIYRDGFVNYNLGMAGAESLILGIVTVIFAFGYLKLQQGGNE
jgi:ABC-type sugar transport system permease subunit